MPIVRTYGDPAVFGMAGYKTGQAQGRAQRDAQQRQLDADFINQAMAGRQRIAEIQTLNNYASERGVPTYSQTPDDGGTATAFNEFAAARKKEREAKAQEADEREGILDGLNSAYSGRDKDFTYYYARDRIMKGETIPDRVLSALGIRSVSEEKALAKARAEEEEGQASDFEPKSAGERAVRSSIQQGRIGDVAAVLDQRGKPEGYGQEAALTTAAMAARTQLAAAAGDISDIDTLKEMRQELQAKGASEESRQIITERIAEIEEEEVKVKAPAAFEQVVSSFKTQLTAAQKQKGAPLDISERRKLLAGTIKTTSQAYGISIERFAAYIRQSEEQRRMAELMVLKAQQETQGGQPQGQTQGQEQPQDPRQQQPQPGPLPGGGTVTPAPRRPAFGQRGAPQ